MRKEIFYHPFLTKILKQDSLNRVEEGDEGMENSLVEIHNVILNVVKRLTKPEKFDSSEFRDERRVNGIDSWRTILQRISVKG